MVIRGPRFPHSYEECRVHMPHPAPVPPQQEPIWTGVRSVVSTVVSAVLLVILRFSVLILSVRPLPITRVPLILCLWTACSFVAGWFLVQSFGFSMFFFGCWSKFLLFSVIFLVFGPNFWLFQGFFWFFIVLLFCWKFSLFSKFFCALLQTFGCWFF